MSAEPLDAIRRASARDHPQERGKGLRMPAAGKASFGRCLSAPSAQKPAPSFAPYVKNPGTSASRRASTPAQEASSHHDRHRRVHRHRTFRRLGRRRCPGRSRGSACRLLHHRAHGVFPHDEPCRALGLRTHHRVVLHLRTKVRRPGLRLCPRLELLLQLGRHDCRGPRGRPAGDEMVVSRRAGRGLERPVSCASLCPQLLLGQGLRRGRVLVCAPEGRHRDHLRAHGAADDCRHPGRPKRSGLGQLEHRRDALCGRTARPGRRGDGGGLLLSGHGACRPHRRRGPGPKKVRAQCTKARLLAHPALLRALHSRHQPHHSLHRSEAAAQRHHRHRRQSLYAGL